MEIFDVFSLNVIGKLSRIHFSRGAGGQCPPLRGAVKYPAKMALGGGGGGGGSPSDFCENTILKYEVAMMARSQDMYQQFEGSFESIDRYNIAL